MHQYDEFIESMLRTSWERRDARQWFAASPRFLWEFDRLETDGIINTIYARGADAVWAVGNAEEIESDSSVNMILLELPKDTDSRKQLFELSAQVAADSGLAGDLDEGQKFMLLRWS